jgi:hypothetical protein
MGRNLTVWIMFSAASAFAGETMNVAVCNLSQVSEITMEHAKAETAYAFRAIDVEIRRMDCGAEIGAQDVSMRPDYIVRVHLGGKIAKAGPVSLEAGGRAFMDDQEYGFMVDAYFGAINDLTLRFPLAGNDQVLGYVIAHELGHLLIGAGHRPNGLMRAASWGKQELEALNHRRLKFNDWKRAAIQRKLHMRNKAAYRAGVVTNSPSLP